MDMLRGASLGMNPGSCRRVVGTTHTGMFVQMVGPSVDIPGGEVTGGKGIDGRRSFRGVVRGHTSATPGKVRHDRWSISLDEVVLIALVATITAR